ncbi:hypothetical protein Tco_0189103 [Tanacetum coccineum]
MILYSVLTALINPEGQQQSSSVSSGFISNMLNPRPDTVSSIPGIVDAYLTNKMREAVKIDQVKEQVKAQVSKILPRIGKTVNEQLKAEVMTHSSTESKTSLAIAANLSELELKKILIEKMESNNSFLTLMVILSRLKDAKMMRIKTKNPQLDQTEAPREDELEKNQSQPVLQRKRHPRQLASQLMGPNLNTSLIVADYGHIKWIKDLVSNTMWSEVPFSDGTLDDVRTALNDRLKGIRMEYLPKTIWEQMRSDMSKSYDPGDRQTAQVKEDNEKFGKICSWETVRG